MRIFYFYSNVIPVLKNNDPLIEEIIDNSVDNNIVYEILEKEKERPKSIDELIEKEIKLEKPLIAKEKKNNVNNNFKIQLASFKKKEKSYIKTRGQDATRTTHTRAHTRTLLQF